MVARVVEEDKLVDVALETAAKIASFSKPITAMAKTCVNQAFETTLKDGILMERRIFYSTFATVTFPLLFFE